MKKIFAFVVAVMLCITACMTITACETVQIEEISIVTPAVTVIKAGESFTLEYTTIPEDAAEKVKVNWNISDASILSYKNGKFTAHTCGTVKVTAKVKGCEATDEIELKVIAPDGFTEYSNTGYKLVYPSNWASSTNGAVRTWTASNGTTNMNITTEPLKTAYFSASARVFQVMMESSYSLMGYTIKFEQPATVKKSKYLGVERVQVNYIYNLTGGGISVKMHQTQMIINNSNAKLTCVLTVTFREENFNDDAAKLQETIFSQFMPA